MKVSKLDVGLDQTMRAHGKASQRGDESGKDTIKLGNNHENDALLFNANTCFANL